jgi:hypothetical protein
MIRSQLKLRQELHPRSIQPIDDLLTAPSQATKPSHTALITTASGIVFSTREFLKTTNQERILAMPLSTQLCPSFGVSFLPETEFLAAE